MFHFSFVWFSNGIEDRKSERSHKSQHIRIFSPPSPSSYTLQLLFSILPIDVQLLSSCFYGSTPFYVHTNCSLIFAVIRRFFKWLTDHDGLFLATSIIRFYFLLFDKIVYFFLLGVAQLLYATYDVDFFLTNWRKQLFCRTFTKQLTLRQCGNAQNVWPFDIRIKQMRNAYLKSLK